jgi:glutamine amidotransferase
VTGPHIAIIDYKVGNLRSVQKSFEHAGLENVVVTDDAAEIESADAIVLPGVGAFRDAANNLRAGGYDEIIRRRIAEGTPLLGICVGLQLLADIGFEDGEWEGLGLVPGTCEKLPAGVKIPHIGWNTVEYPRESPLFDGIPESTAFYFVHSYRIVPRDPDAIVGSAEYGVRFAAAVQSGTVYAVQFHPEKSSTMGLKLLENFGRLAERSAS